MKTLSLAAAALTLSLASSAFAQMADGTQPAAPAGQPAAGAQFAPDATKGPEDTRGLAAAIKANNDAWDHQDTNAVLNAWAFPATVITTDGAGNPTYVQVDQPTVNAAFAGLFAAIPKPSPGQKAAEIKFAAPKIEWVSHQLAVVTAQANLTQGFGKAQFKKSWKVSQIWTRDAQGNWRVRGYVASGWGDLLKH